jgi:hypothetical protein
MWSNISLIILFHGKMDWKSEFSAGAPEGVSGSDIGLE